MTEESVGAVHIDVANLLFILHYPSLKVISAGYSSLCFWSPLTLK